MTDEALDRTVRVRFAPSPTGNLHIGGARTALFNWLFARHHGGAFVLRIEDTDLERSREEHTREILASMEWLGLCHDEGPIFQSRRLDRYRAAALELVEQGKAYRCFCSPAELEERRQAAQGKGETFHYDGRCGCLSPERIAHLEQTITPALRIRVPAGTSSWNDLVRGPITFDNATLDDLVIFKSDGRPTYHFAVVVDDVDMDITHVIRGDDHISNTPKQLVIYEALGAAAPVFAHIPLIHGTDGGRLSKRHGATAVLDYRRMGFLPGAVVNYLALLGWSPGDDREIMPLAELVKAFDLGRVVKTPAVFDLEKLTWMNAHYLAAMTVAVRTAAVLPFWLESGLLRPGEEDSRWAWLGEVVKVTGERIRTLADIVPQTTFFFRDVEPDEQARKVLEKAASEREALGEAVRALEALPVFTHQALEEALRQVIAVRGIGAGKLMQPLRAALTGRTASPGLYECLELVGKERSLERLRRHLPL